MAQAEERRGFLSPYRALDLTDERGLLAGSMFGRLGADVIQVEAPEGSSARHVPPFAQDAPPRENSLYWSAYASGKRGITCAIDRSQGRALLQRLAVHADVIFESQGAQLHADLQFDALHRINPRLIQVSITGFGSNGPKVRYADTDLIAWAAGGPLWPNRDLHGQPLRYSVPQAYLHAAADAASGALMAVHARRRTGKGQHVDISAQQSAAPVSLSEGLSAAVGDTGFTMYPYPPMSDDVDPSEAARPGKWRVKDGIVELHIGLGAATGRFDNKFFEWMRRQGALPAGVADWDWEALPQLMESGEVTLDHVNKARSAVAACLARYTKREIMDLVLSEKLIMGPSLTVAEIRDDVHFNRRGLFETVHENGRSRTMPGRLAVTTVAGHVVRRPAPRLGEHNEEVYRELLAISAQELAKLRSEGVI
jgi:crotonobetainyl-CoA:carnitine CoA-transferase CaiB-like acyl-CoA transferase